MTGTRPAVDTRFGSSKDADIAVGLCNNCTCEVPFWPGESGLYASLILPVQEGISYFSTPLHLNHIGGSRLIEAREETWPAKKHITRSPRSARSEVLRRKQSHVNSRKDGSW